MADEEKLPDEPEMPDIPYAEEPAPEKPRDPPMPSFKEWEAARNEAVKLPKQPSDFDRWKAERDARPVEESDFDRWSATHKRTPKEPAETELPPAVAKKPVEPPEPTFYERRQAARRKLHETQKSGRRRAAGNPGEIPSPLLPSAYRSPDEQERDRQDVIMSAVPREELPDLQQPPAGQPPMPSLPGEKSGPGGDLGPIKATLEKIVEMLERQDEKITQLTERKQGIFR